MNDIVHEVIEGGIKRALAQNSKTMKHSKGSPNFCNADISNHHDVKKRIGQIVLCVNHAAHPCTTWLQYVVFHYGTCIQIEHWHRSIAPFYDQLTYHDARRHVIEFAL